MIRRILEKTDIEFDINVLPTGQSALKHALLEMIGYLGVIPHQLLEESDPEKRMKWMLAKLFKMIALTRGKQVHEDDFIAIITGLNYGQEIRSESQFLKLFKIEPIFKDHETYFSLYHHLFIFLGVNTFIDATFDYFESGVAHLGDLRRQDDLNNELFLDLIFYLIMVDGQIHKHERKVFSELTSMVYKTAYPQTRVILDVLLEKIIASGLDPFLLRTVYKIAVITIMIDDRETKEERVAMEEIQRVFQISLEEHDRLMMEVANYLYNNQEVIYRSGFRKIFSSFEKQVIKRMQSLLVANKDNIVAELSQTKDMTVLIGRWLQGDKLTKKEQDQVGEQMKDVLKAIPALGIFALPGGTVLLPILAKILPFNILPSSFDKEKRKKDDGGGSI